MHPIEQSDTELKKSLARAEAKVAALQQTLLRTQQALDLNQYNLSLAEVFIVALDSQARINYVGGNGLQQIGYEPTDLLGRDWFKICCSNPVYESNLQSYQQLMSGELPITPDETSSILTRDKKLLDVTWHHSLLTDAAGHITGRMSTGTNICDPTSAAAKENKLFSETGYRAIVEAAQDGIWTIDTNHRTTLVNPRLCEILGYTADEMLGRSLFDFMDQGGRVSAQENLKRRRAGVKEQYEFKFMRKDGVGVWTIINTCPLLDDNGAYCGALAIVTDISARKANDLLFKKTQQMLETAQQNTHTGNWWWDLEDRRLTLSNEAFRLYGLEPDQSASAADIVSLIEKSLHAEDKPRVMECFTRCLQTGVAAEAMEYRVIWPDQSEHTLYAESELICDAQGNPSYSYCVLQDITERKQSEQALRDSEQRYRLLFENMTSGFALHEIICDTQGHPMDYRYLELNPAFEKLTGVPASALLGKTVLEILPETEDYWIQSFGKVALTGEPMAYENYSKELGKYYDTWVFSPQKNQFAVIFSDVTERKQAEIDLRASEEKFRILTEASPIGVFLKDAEGKSIYMNQRCVQMMVGTTELVPDCDLTALLHPEDRVRIGTIRTKVTGAHEIFCEDYRWLHADGKIVWTHGEIIPILDDAGQVTQYIGALVDISERKLAEEKILKLQLEQQQIINTLVEAVISIDEHGTILSYSQSAESMFGYTASEILGENIKRLMPPNYASRHNNHLEKYLATGETNMLGTAREVEGMRKSGESFPMQLSVAELPRSPNGQRRFIGSCQDITLYRIQEEQLRRSQKMDALGKLTGGIAHDYNNLLGIILGYTQLLKDALADTPKLYPYIKEIDNASKRAARLSKKLLGFSKHSQPLASDVNINDLLLAEQEMLEKTLTPRINLRMHCDTDMWPIHVDSNDLEDVVLNLCINAMHAMPSGGEITISTDRKTLNDTDMENHSLAPGDYVALRIKDTGTGIAPEIISKIFDPFFTTKGAQGVGLGLSQAYGFMQRCQGDIQVKSTPGMGAEFSLFFPRSTEDQNNKTISDAHSTNAVQGRETILVVDDEPAIATLADTILRAKGYQVLTATSARQALEILQSTPVDLLLSDVVMPNMDGFQLAAIVQQNHPSIAIQLVSGYNESAQLPTSNPILEENLLAKPYTADMLLHQVRDCLDIKDQQPKAQPLSVLVMDDDPSLLALFVMNLNKLGYITHQASSTQQTLANYRLALDKGTPYDFAILDIAMSEEIDGADVAREILTMHPQAKLIVASGDSTGLYMTNYQKFGFCGALEKDFNREKMQASLHKALHKIE